MANCKQYRKKAEEKPIEIDLFPKSVQQPRSPAPKRRTDFSLFFSSHSSSPPSVDRGLSPETPGIKDTLSNMTAVSPDSSSGKRKNMPSISQCADEGSGLSMPCAAFQVMEAKFDPQNKHVNHSSSRNNQIRKVGMMLEFSSEKFVAGHEDLCRNPVMGEGLTCADSEDANVDEHVLVQVQCHGSQSACSDPTEDNMPQAEDASHVNGDLSSPRRLSGHHDELNNSDDHKQSSGSVSDKWKSTSSSRTEGELEETGRGKRKRKPKVHFDELTSPIKSGKKDRRFKIMRFLGLAAPVGSPFTFMDRGLCKHNADS